MSEKVLFIQASYKYNNLILQSSKLDEGHDAVSLVATHPRARSGARQALRAKDLSALTPRSTVHGGWTVGQLQASDRKTHVESMRFADKSSDVISAPLGTKASYMSKCTCGSGCPSVGFPWVS